MCSPQPLVGLLIATTSPQDPNPSPSCFPLHSTCRIWTQGSERRSGMCTSARGLVLTVSRSTSSRQPCSSRQPRSAPHTSHLPRVPPRWLTYTHTNDSQGSDVIFIHLTPMKRLRRLYLHDYGYNPTHNSSWEGISCEVENAWKHLDAGTAPI